MGQQYCQSCSMPLDQDPQGGGTEDGGEKSTEYCSFCYKDGKFMNPEMTVEQMQELVKGKMKEMHAPDDVIEMSVKMIPSLQRWSS